MTLELNATEPYARCTSGSSTKKSKSTKGTASASEPPERRPTMAEKRFIARRITESDKIRSLANDGRLLPITLYTFLLPYLDREGRMNANPMVLKGGLFEGYAWTLEELEDALHDLAAVGLIHLYS